MSYQRSWSGILRTWSAAAVLHGRYGEFQHPAPSSSTILHPLSPPAPRRYGEFQHPSCPARSLSAASTSPGLCWSGTWVRKGYPSPCAELVGWGRLFELPATRIGEVGLGTHSALWWQGVCVSPPLTQWGYTACHHLPLLITLLQGHIITGSRDKTAIVWEQAECDTNTPAAERWAMRSVTFPVPPCAPHPSL